MNIFLSYGRMEVVADGKSAYDFLGGVTRVDYRHGWRDTVIPAGTHIRPSYPGPSEWIADWIVTLVAAKIAGESFSVIELGAGYGQWMVTAIRAFKSLRPSGTVYGLAMEADDVHFEWLKEHCSGNLGSFSGVTTDLVHAAAGKDGTVEFPVLDEPSKDYAASYMTRVFGDPSKDYSGAHTARFGQRLVSVRSMSLTAIMQRVHRMPVDLLHIDIQGAEEDLLLSSDIVEPLKQIKFIMVGTHTNELHDRIKNKMRALGFTLLIVWPRNSVISTEIGEIRTTDGALVAVNSRSVDVDNVQPYFGQYIALV